VPPFCFSARFRASTRLGARISPRFTWNSATRWISLSCRAASPGRASVCQYVVAAMRTTMSPIATRATRVS
jgi:hypothetical protein